MIPLPNPEAQAGAMMLEAPSAFSRYAPPPGHYDEVVRPSGLPRRHWRQLALALRAMGPEEFRRRWQAGRQLIHENGITYNVYGDPQGADRPWQLDPIPMVISTAEWAGIEAAIIQRARLFNTMLADLYGPQRLVSEGLLPHELVFANPAFLRACHGIPAPQGAYLNVYAADLARSPDGQWWVIADRTQAPSGAGYALENRVVSTRILPDVFHETNVRRLARYFQGYRDMLISMAPAHFDNPRIVLLTPGPYNETYFEHSYLAKYLGYTLVEGADLAVRDDRVYLKTLSGLLPVDVILRRLDDSFCDPIELRGDSLLGIPGLVNAARKGTVAVANALGSGLVETAANMAFLPGLCRQLLGEELKMPSVATWWCGQPEPRRYVLENFEGLVIKPTFPTHGVQPVFGASLDRQGREELAARIEASPAQYVAQEQVALSTAPIWTEEGMAPRFVIVRVYAAWSGGSYNVMPGGLSRISASENSLVVSMQGGGGSKDTWILGATREEPVTLFRKVRHPIDINRATFDLPSRIADNLFWLGRYTERFESSVRLARVILPGLTEDGDLGSALSLTAAISILEGMHYIRHGLASQPPALQRRALERELTSMVFDRKRTTGLGWNVEQVRRVAWLLRERISGDTWRVLNRLDDDFSARAPSGAFRVSAAVDLLDRSVLTLAAFSGLVMESMTRGQGWRFLDIGRRLERASQMVDLLRFGLVSGPDDEAPRLDTVLRIADSSITYRSRYLTTMQTDLVLDLLLADEANPRSVAFQLASLEDHVEKLPRPASPARHPLEARLIMKALTAVRLCTAEELAKPGPDGRRPEFEKLLETLRADLLEFSETLTRSYLSHAVPSRLLAVP